MVLRLKQRWIKQQQESYVDTALEPMVKEFSSEGVDGEVGLYILTVP